MKIEIIAVGDEVLRGEVWENNSSYLSRVLAGVGLEPWRISVLPDNVAVLGEEIRAATARSEVILVTGGLGPTVDDITKEAVIRALECATEFRGEVVDQIASRFKEFGRQMPASYRDQGMIPSGAEVLPNKIGLAVGLRIRSEDFELFLLPGVPAEMKEMFKQSVLPSLSAPGSDARVRLRTFALIETEVEERLERMMGGDGLKRLSIISAPSGVDIYIPIGIADGDMLERAEEVFGSYLYALGETEMEEVVVGLLREKGKTLSTAESITGGLLASTLVSIPGASDCFIEGFVAYSNDAKIERLGVDAGSIDMYGAVSSEVCAQMAIGSMKRTGTDLALSTTGIAGPGGVTPAKPAGLCYIGLAAQDGLFCRRLQLPGDRGMVRHRTAVIALDMLRLYLLGEQGRLESFRDGGKA